jgi:putative transposase
MGKRHNHKLALEGGQVVDASLSRLRSCVTRPGHQAAAVTGRTSWQPRLVISDHHLGLKAAIAKVFIGAAWQRCRVHFMRNVLAKVTRANGEMVAAAIRTIFAQPDAAVAAQFERITATLQAQFPEVVAMLIDAKEDLLAFCAFPLEHWRKLWSTNPLERLDREIKRRCDVVGVFPTTAPSTAR